MILWKYYVMKWGYLPNVSSCIEIRHEMNGFWFQKVAMSEISAIYNVIIINVNCLPDIYCVGLKEIIQFVSTISMKHNMAVTYFYTMLILIIVNKNV